MAYNKAREEYKWKLWKEREEKKMRELGMAEEAIQALRESDWEDFKAERRFREHQTTLQDYMEILLKETSETEPQVQNVEELLNAVADEQLLHTLLETDRETLQILVLEMMGYTPKEISRCMGKPEQTIYTKIRRLREKIKKFSKAE